MKRIFSKESIDVVDSNASTSSSTATSSSPSSSSLLLSSSSSSSSSSTAYIHHNSFQEIRDGIQHRDMNEVKQGIQHAAEDFRHDAKERVEIIGQRFRVLFTFEEMDPWFQS
jgi:hypothetical protein